MVDVLDHVEENINLVKTVKRYLQARTEFLPSEHVTMMPDEPQFTKVKITVNNSAPVLSDPVSSLQESD